MIHIPTLAWKLPGPICSWCYKGQCRSYCVYGSLPSSSLETCAISQCLSTSTFVALSPHSIPSSIKTRYQAAGLVGPVGIKPCIQIEERMFVLMLDGLTPVLNPADTSELAPVSWLVSLRGIHGFTLSWLLEAIKYQGWEPLPRIPVGDITGK